MRGVPPAHEIKEERMELTSISKENLEYFMPFTGGPLAPDESALGLIDEDAAIGALVLSEKEAVCTIESIFVAPEYRRKGGGTLLLDAVKVCGEDMESLQKEDLKEFVKLYRKLSSSEYGSGKNNAARYEETLKVLGDQRLKKDGPVLEKVIGDAKLSGKKDVDNFLENSFTQKKAELIATYSEDDHEFIQKVKPDVSGKVEGFDDKAIMEYEKILLGVFDSAKIEGKTISPEHMEGLKGKLHEYTELRREYFAVQKVCVELSQLQSGGLCDYQNPSLMESEIGKKLEMIIVRELVNINKLLNGQIPGFEQALVKRHSDNMKTYGISMT